MKMYQNQTYLFMPDSAKEANTIVRLAEEVGLLDNGLLPNMHDDNYKMGISIRKGYLSINPQGLTRENGVWVDPKMFIHCFQKRVEESWLLICKDGNSHGAFDSLEGAEAVANQYCTGYLYTKKVDGVTTEQKFIPR